ncbi:MAG: DUF1844 domain-containing protein [Phycisphaerales bacterium]|nr:DUF1844 domain-containing protein [Phycisphaerales bacterium]
MPDADRPKIIIDDDWKAQAQAEKAKLAEQEKARTPTPASGFPAGAPTGAPGRTAPAPTGPGPPAAEPGDELGFTDLVQVLASQALMYMGAIPDPQSGKAFISPPMAKAHIDLLGVVEDKTKGNLTAEETQLLQGILHELRMQFVELGKAINQAIKEGRISPQQAGEAGLGFTPPPGPLG